MTITYSYVQINNEQISRLKNKKTKNTRQHCQTHKHAEKKNAILTTIDWTTTSITGFKRRDRLRLTAVINLIVYSIYLLI